MEQNQTLQERPPSYAQSHDPQSVHLPSVPTADPPLIHHERTLPSLPLAPPESRHQPEEHPVWPSSNPLTAYYQPGPSQLSPKTASATSTDSPNRMDVDTPDSQGRRGGSVLSIDDPDVRLAAEALGDLRADFVQSPTQRNLSLPPNSPPASSHRGAQQLEPLLSLLTTSHPLLGTAIGGSLSAYSASKNFSPTFKTSAEFLENRFTPVVNTITSVNRMTGVEGGVRWFLGGRRPSHLESREDGHEGSNKRRKFDTNDEEADRHISRDQYPVYRQELQHHHRAPSQASLVDSLPAYDEHRSPSYEDGKQALIPMQDSNEVSASSNSWQSRLVMSTSGLSVAMSEESLRRLKYCLGWLRWANGHIGKDILALKSVLERYKEAPADSSQAIADSVEKGEEARSMVVRSEAERTALHAKIAELKQDVMKTLKNAVDIVSKYAGGALPENARILVRKHLTSLPRRFRLANSRTGELNPRGLEQGDAKVSEGANRVLVLAQEGLDMIAQISGVLDGTIISAEEWCERLGRKKREEAEGRIGSPAQLSRENV
ncbi:clock-controlled protein-like protein 8 [Amylocarpus encephaloides]|uniref:Clock-controlled protein-like protein 8 n=1 Tax=Amylocarpus encephaloides TaxID=45428 RepID=A0A9P7YMH4_9HELO|nr:clock-controlled protein-like protein 8 [Amylocarpus encephaloides]